MPGASVDATLIVAQHDNALVVPITSVVNRNEQSVVFLLQGERVQAQPVSTGWREDGWVEIINGLAESDSLVVEGAGLLSDNSLVIAAVAP